MGKIGELGKGGKIQGIKCQVMYSVESKEGGDGGYFKVLGSGVIPAASTETLRRELYVYISVGDTLKPEGVTRLAEKGGWEEGREAGW